MSEELHGIRAGKKGRLGRGLGSLLGEHRSVGFGEQRVTDPLGPDEALPEASDDVQRNSKLKESLHSFPIEWVFPNPDQPRRHFEPQALKELSDSIREKGILQPIVARRRDDQRFEIISGERRWRAAQTAGLKHVPVILREADARESLELALIENIQRENLNPIEEAEAYLKLIEQHGLTQQQISERVSKDRATVANTLRLLNLPIEVRNLVAQGTLSTGHAKVLLSVGDDQQIKKLSQKVITEKLSVRALERILNGSEEQAHSSKAELPSADQRGVNDVLQETREVTEPSPQEKAASHLALELQRNLGTKVSITYSGGRGHLNIFFYSDEELTHLVERFSRE